MVDPLSRRGGIDDRLMDVLVLDMKRLAVARKPTCLRDPEGERVRYRGPPAAIIGFDVSLRSAYS